MTQNFSAFSLILLSKFVWLSLNASWASKCLGEISCPSIRLSVLRLAHQLLSITVSLTHYFRKFYYSLYPYLYYVFDDTSRGNYLSKSTNSSNKLVSAIGVCDKLWYLIFIPGMCRRDVLNEEDWSRGGSLEKHTFDGNSRFHNEEEFVWRIYELLNQLWRIDLGAPALPLSINFMAYHCCCHLGTGRLTSSYWC